MVPPLCNYDSGNHEQVVVLIVVMSCGCLGVAFSYASLRAVVERTMPDAVVFE